jgi:hypothetical protein
MFSKCANPDCSMLFDYRQGRLFRFDKNPEGDEKPPNTYCVQHFWLCAECSQQLTLEYKAERGVLLRCRPDLAYERQVSRLIAVA